MSSNESSSSSFAALLTRCKQLIDNPVNRDESATGPSTNIPSLRDDEWSDEGSPNRASPVNDNDEKEDSSTDVDIEIVGVENPNVKTLRGKRQRALRRKAGVKKGPEFFQCDNDSDILPSWCTENQLE